MFWFNRETEDSFQIQVQIECIKFDISKMKSEIAKTENKLILTETTINALINNLEYLQKYSKITSLIEFNKLKAILAKEYEGLSAYRRLLQTQKKEIKVQEDKLQKTEEALVLANIKHNNVLEFKRRDNKR